MTSIEEGTNGAVAPSLCNTVVVTVEVLVVDRIALMDAILATPSSITAPPGFDALFDCTADIITLHVVAPGVSFNGIKTVIFTGKVEYGCTTPYKGLAVIMGGL
jgi:hypothetical protein